MRGEFQQVLDHLGVAERTAEALGDRRRLAWTHMYLSNSAWQIGDYQRAIAYGQRALATATALGDVGLQGVATFRLGQAYHGACDFARAADVLQQSVDHLRGDLLRERFGVAGAPAIFSRGFAAWSLAELGEFGRGLALGNEAVEIAESIDHPHTVTIACFAVGILHARKGELEAARLSLERAVSLCRGRGIITLFPVSVSSLAYVYALLGRREQVLELAEESVEPVAIRKATHPSFPYLWAGEACLLAGQTARASELAQQALGLARRHQETGHEAYARRLMGEIAARHELATARSGEVHYLEARRLAREVGMRPLEAQCHLGLGKLLRRDGRFDEARAELATAIERFDALGMTFWPPEADAELALATAARSEQQVR
jgi:tetratricopeptide (TPR) repeat protein